MSSELIPSQDLIYRNAASLSGGLTGVGTAAARPSSFLQPTLLSWINAPYYQLPQEKFQNAFVPSDSTLQEKTQLEKELPVQG